MSRFLSCVLIASFVFSPSINYAQQVSVPGLPKPGTLLDLSAAYEPVLIKGLKVHQDNALALDFIVDTGDSGLKLNRTVDKKELGQESEKLIKYFLAALTLPETEVWVNLSPFEKDRIIPEALSQTEMGRDMLEEDYILKQITASLMYPKKGLGQDFWDKIYKEAYQKFGATQVPVNTFNKVWIVADKASVYENKDTAFVTGSHLKVMLEEDYLSMQKHATPSLALPTKGEGINFLGSQIVRQIILPALEKEVNEGRNFANLRQIFHSLILAKWYKQALKQTLINQVYSNKAKIVGVNVDDKAITQKIYNQYLQAYKKGVFNFIREDLDQNTHQSLARKYFSGGVRGDVALTVNHRSQDAAVVATPRGNYVLVQNVMGRQDAAMTTKQPGTWQRRGYDENVYTVLSGTNATVVLNERERAAATTIHIANWEHTEETARQYLYTKRLGELVNSPIRVKLLSKELKYGYAIDHDTKIIYVSPKFYLKLQDQEAADNFDFWVRKSVFLLINDHILGQKYEYEYAYDHFKERVFNLFPPGSEPEQLLRGIEDAILLNGLNDHEPGIVYQNLAYDISNVRAKELQFVPISEKDRIYQTVRENKIAVIEPGEPAKVANEEVLKRARDAMYIIGLNALDGIADYRHGAAHSTAQFSSKFNPISIAQTFITILYTYAISGASSYGVTVSEFDPRKPDVQKSFPARLSLASTEIQSFFHHLVTIIQNRDEIRTWNGEEVAIIQASKIHPLENGQNYFYLYTAGGDHFYIWAPFNASTNDLPTLVGFDEVNDETRKYYSFYAGIGEGQKYGLKWQEYKKLVKEQNEKGDRKFYDVSLPLDEKEKSSATLNMKERQRVINAILSGKSAKDLEEVFKHATILPRLDTAGKMVLARKALPHIDFVLAHTIRKGENFGDKLRDDFIAQQELKIFNVDGLNAAVAATRTREGLISFLFGIINFNLLYGASKPTLRKVFDSKDRAPLEILLRQSPLMLPKSISNMLHDKEAEHQRMFSKLQRHLSALIKGSTLEESTSSFSMDNQDRIKDRGESIVTIKRGEQVLLIVKYQIENTFDQEGRPLNKLHSNVVFKNAGYNGRIEEIILDYIRQYNGVKDSAMSVEDMTPGGIDFNANQLQLNVQKRGSGVGINFDPELIKKFQNGNFQGFVPVIINIRPIADIAPMLGLSKKEVGGTGLVKA